MTTTMTTDELVNELENRPLEVVVSGLTCTMLATGQAWYYNDDDKWCRLSLKELAVLVASGDYTTLGFEAGTQETRRAIIEALGGNR